MQAKDRKHRENATSGTGSIKMDNRKLPIGQKKWFVGFVESLQ